MLKDVEKTGAIRVSGAVTERLASPRVSSGSSRVVVQTLLSEFGIRQPA
jgi:hypothetical protein